MSRLLAFIHGFVGIGAIGGGLGAILNPEGPMGAPVSLLENSPFSNFLIPGIILFSVIGLGNIISALMVHTRSRFHAYVSSIFSWALVIWIIVQCIMLQAVNYLHVIFFVIGVIEVVLATILIFRQSLYPLKIIKNGVDIVKKKIGQV